MNAGTQIVELLELDRQPVAIQFQDTAPPGTPHIEHAAPAGCTYWKYAADGRTFYTEAADHYGCPIGSHTHGINLPEDKAKELEGLVDTMVQLQYLDMAEVSNIPRRAEPFGVVVYAPLADATFEPDVVLITGNAKQMMLLGEAVRSAGIASDTSLVGRPTCAAIPAVLRSGHVASNLGCIGNRVYTELPDDQLYFAIAGLQLAPVIQKLVTIVHANRELEKFHRARAS